MLWSWFIQSHPHALSFLMETRLNPESFKKSAVQTISSFLDGLCKYHVFRLIIGINREHCSLIVLLPALGRKIVVFLCLGTLDAYKRELLGLLFPLSFWTWSAAFSPCVKVKDTIASRASTVTNLWIISTGSTDQEAQRGTGAQRSRE